MKIPIANIYYLMLYAWNVLDEDDVVDVDAVDCTTLIDLFARVLHSGTDHVLRRGLDRGYLEYRSSLPGVRGRIDIGQSVKTVSRRQARIVCVFDELDYNLLHNRILKTTIRRLLDHPNLTEELHEPLAETYLRLSGIEEVQITDLLFRRVQVHRNNRSYRFLMDVCRILHKEKLLSPEDPTTTFRSFVDDEHRMRKLFERFVRNFYHREQCDFKVCSNGLNWAITKPPNRESLRYLPKMRTDIRLRSQNRAIVIDTKFVSDMFQERYNKATLRSSHLYQLFAYLRNLAAKGGCYTDVEGILLYPATSAQPDFEYELDGHRVRACTIDLAQPHPKIHARLLELLA